MAWVSLLHSHKVKILFSTRQTQNVIDKNTYLDRKLYDAASALYQMVRTLVLLIILMSNEIVWFLLCHLGIILFLSECDMICWNFGYFSLLIPKIFMLAARTEDVFFPMIIYSSIFLSAELYIDWVSKAVHIRVCYTPPKIVSRKISSFLFVNVSYVVHRT